MNLFDSDIKVEMYLNIHDLPVKTYKWLFGFLFHEYKNVEDRIILKL